MQMVVLLLHLWDLSIPVTLSKLWLLMKFWLLFTAASFFNRISRNREHTDLHNMVHFYGTPRSFCRQCVLDSADECSLAVSLNH